MDVLLGIIKMLGMIVVGLGVLVLVASLENTIKNSLRNLRFQRENKEF